jgi:transposase
LTPDQRAQVQQALQQPQGFVSYDAVRQWIADHLGVHLSYNATRKLVRYKLGAKLKAPRPSHIKKRRRDRHLQAGVCDAPPDGAAGHAPASS